MRVHVRELGAGPPVVLAPPRPRASTARCSCPAPSRWPRPATACCSSTCPAAGTRRPDRRGRSPRHAARRRAARARARARGLDAARALVRRVRRDAAPRRLPGQRHAAHRLLHRRERGRRRRARRRTRSTGCPPRRDGSRVRARGARSRRAEERCKDAGCDQMPRFADDARGRARGCCGDVAVPARGGTPEPRLGRAGRARRARASPTTPVLAIGGEHDRAHHRRRPRARIASTAPQRRAADHRGRRALPVRRAARPLLAARWSSWLDGARHA